jgi:hypothetical protein
MAQDIGSKPLQRSIGGVGPGGDIGGDRGVGGDHVPYRTKNS